MKNNKKLLLVILTVLQLPLSAQFNTEFDYTKRIINRYHIKSITTWYFNERDSTGQDSVLNSVHVFDKNGNLLQFQPRMYSKDSGDFSRNYYEYDSTNHVVSTYTVSKGMNIIDADEFIYDRNLLMEWRSYNTFGDFSYEDRHLTRSKTYYGDRNTYNKNGQLVSSSFCNFNSIPDADSLVEEYDSNTRMTRLFNMSRVRPICDSIRCLRTTNYQYDIAGNLIRKKTTPGSNVFIDDSFAYDQNNNMVYRVNFEGHHDDNPRKRRKGEVTETFYENTYNDKGQLIEIKTYFKRDRQCVLRTCFEYDERDTLRQVIVFKTYREGSNCHVASSLAGLYYKPTGNLPDSFISDTLSVKVNNAFGEDIDWRIYYGRDEDKNKQGTLQFRDFHQTDSLGINQYVETFYGKTQYWNKSAPEKPWTYRRYYTHYPNGLIRDIKQEKGNVVYRIVYTFY